MVNILEELRADHIDAIGYKDYMNWSATGSFNAGGIAVHHIAGVFTNDLNMASLLYHGHDDLAGPLCNIGISNSARVYVVCNRKGRDTGMGDFEVYRRAYQGLPPRPPGPDNTNLNPYFYDIEMEGPPFTVPQLTICKRVCATLCRNRGWNENHVVAHFETTTRKQDPKNIDMNLFRAHVKGYILEGDDMPPYREWHPEDKKALAIDVANQVFARLQPSGGDAIGDEIDMLRRLDRRIRDHHGIPPEAGDP